jgi:hypothetical protein
LLTPRHPKPRAETQAILSQCALLHNFLPRFLRGEAARIVVIPACYSSFMEATSIENRLVDLLDWNHLDVGGDVVLAAEVQHILSLGNSANGEPDRLRRPDMRLKGATDGRIFLLRLCFKEILTKVVVSERQVRIQLSSQESLSERTIYGTNPMPNSSRTGKASSSRFRYQSECSL